MPGSARQQGEPALQPVSRAAVQADPPGAEEALERPPGSSEMGSSLDVDGLLALLDASVPDARGWDDHDLAGFEPLAEGTAGDGRGLVVYGPDGLERVLSGTRPADGAAREAGAAGRLRLGDSALEVLIASGRDLAECRRLEQQLRDAHRLESVGRLAAGLAHDLNNVLTVILSGGHALRDQLDHGEPVSREDVDEVNEAAERARHLTRRLLEVARRPVTAPAPLDLNLLLEDARRMLGRLVGEEVELVLELEQGLWPVRLDPAQVDQILLNLVVNARDALPRGGRIEIATRNLELQGPSPAWPAARPGQYVALRVSDDGVGMSPRVRDRLFDPFFTTKPAGRGSGLGLGTVQGIVAQNGGHVRVESEPGRGTSFVLLLARTR